MILFDLKEKSRNRSRCSGKGENWARYLAISYIRNLRYNGAKGTFQRSRSHSPLHALNFNGILGNTVFSLPIENCKYDPQIFRCTMCVYDIGCKHSFVLGFVLHLN